MRVLVIGKGGREHALCWKIKQSPLLSEVYAAPGNPGIAKIAKCVDVKETDITGLITVVQSLNIDLVVVGPEVPLVMGLADELNKEGVRVFGPSQAAARLEGSKSFMKQLCLDYDIPTAKSSWVDSIDLVKDSIANDFGGLPVVIKADGLAAGKGVFVVDKEEELEAALVELAKLEDAITGGILIEDKLEGYELSFFALSDGTNLLPLCNAQDHKQIFDGDKGPNTGGMGAFTPVEYNDSNLDITIIKHILEPTVKAMNDRGCPFVGVLFCGLMITEDGPYVLEYNVRFGDPECQVIMPRLKSDLLELMIKAIDGDLTCEAEFHNNIHVSCVNLVSGGYPGEYKVGLEIHGQKVIDSYLVFHAGTAMNDDKLVTNGGRVLSVVGLGRSLDESLDQAYGIARNISFSGIHYRTDIGKRMEKGSI